MTWSKLHDACEHNTTESILQLAKESSYEAFDTDDHNATPLHLLCLNSPEIEALKALVVANPAAVTYRDINGNTPVHLLCQHPDITREHVEVLVSADSHCLTVANKHGYLALHVACFFAPQNYEVIAFLVKMNPYALLHHIKVGELVKKRSSKRSGPTHMIDHEAGLKTIDAIDLRFMYEDVERDGAYPLHLAIAHGAPLKIVELLVHSGREVLEMTNKHGQTPLLVSLWSNADDDVVRFLVQSYPEALHVPDKRGSLPIHVAAKHSVAAPLLKTLLQEWPASASKVDGDGLNAGDLALQAGNCSEEVTKLLSIPNYEKTA